MLVTILGVRSKIVEFIPRSVMLATAAGIGACWVCCVGRLAGSGSGNESSQEGGCPVCGCCVRLTLPCGAPGGLMRHPPLPPSWQASSSASSACRHLR